MKNRYYFLELKALTVLFQLCGIDKRIFFPKEKGVMEEKEWLQLLHGLSKREILVNKGESFQVEGEFAVFMKVIGDSDYQVMLDNRANETALLYFYGTKCLWIEETDHRRGMLRFCLLTRKELVEKLEECRILPPRQEERPDWSNLPVKLPKGKFCKEAFSVLQKEPDMLFCMEIFEKDRHCGQLCLMDSPLYYYLECRTPERTKQWTYSCRQFERLLAWKWLKDEESQ